MAASPSYRSLVTSKDLASYRVKIGESDLALWSTKDEAARAQRLLLEARKAIVDYLPRSPLFLDSLSPLPPDPTASPLVQKMLKAGKAAGVGPMAAVAGAIAEFVAEGLGSPEVIIENGGDLYLKIKRTRTIALFAGEKSPFSYELGLSIHPEQTPIGVCTSSGTVGHAKSFGQADAVTILSSNCALADAAATAVANIVLGPDSIAEAIVFAQKIPQVRGVLIACSGKFGAWGQVELVKL